MSISGTWLCALCHLTLRVMAALAVALLCYAQGRMGLLKVVLRWKT